MVETGCTSRAGKLRSRSANKDVPSITAEIFLNSTHTYNSAAAVNKYFSLLNCVVRISKEAFRNRRK